MKKIITLILMLLSINSVFATEGDLPFSDIKKTDELYDDLSLLYKNNVIKASDDNLFHPDALVPRDEMLSIIVGVGCKDCIHPSIEDFLKYDLSPFIDVNKLLSTGNVNPYFYCISIGKNDGITQGYILNSQGEYTCENNETFTSTPFCPTNNTTRIEAVALLLRTAKIWDAELNSQVVKTIKISDIDDQWYGFARKGIEIGILKKDSEDKVYPNESLNRREFVHMATKIFGLNFCELKKAGINELSGDIKIYDKNTQDSCSGDSPETKFSNPTETTYDFTAYTENSGDFEYTWEFTNSTTGEVKTATGKCLDNFDLVTDGKWIVKLVIKDKTTEKSTTAYSQVTVSNTSDTSTGSKISVGINADPLIGDAPLPVDFTSIVSGTIGEVQYMWDFGDGNFSNSSTPNHVYEKEGVYNVTLKVIDSKGNVGVSGLTVEVVKNLDTDGDGLNDKIDSCPLVAGPISNKGCPIIKEYDGDKNYPSTLSSEIKIYDKTSSTSFKGEGNLTTFPNKLETTYDFYGYTENIGDFEYKWEFTNIKTGDIKATSGKFLNNYVLDESGIRTVKLVITEKTTGKNTTSYSQVSVGTDNLLSSSITGTPILGAGPLNVDLKSYINGGDGNYTYSWAFGDGGSSNEKDPNHTFTNPGVYTVTLTTTDGSGKTSTSQIQIQVIGADKDTDGDGIKDSQDYCPNVPGVLKNNGCPDVNKNYGLNNVCLIEKASGNGIIEGTLQCITCPCVYSIEYLASIRGCDILFPAITSPDKKTLYSRGKIYQVK